MNFALICDSSNISSYICDEGKVYYLNSNKPYYRSHHISNECLMGFWNYPILFDGYFINIKEQLLPDIKFDIIFAAIEKNTKNLDIIREKYPKAKIYGTLKELDGIDFNVRRYLINNTEGFVEPYLSWNYIPNAIKIPQPINVDYLKNNYFISDKKEWLFDYSNYWAAHRIGKNKEFFNMMTDKYHIKTYKTYSDNINQWVDFILSWNNIQFQINTDPTTNYGQQAIQCAALGVIVMGGLNDSHKILFPTLATNDLGELKIKLSKMIVMIN